MTVRITGPGPQRDVGRPTSRPPEKKKADGAESGASTARADSVAISGKEAAVQAVKAAEVSDVDEAKVAELRAKIASGEYTADLRVVAERIIAEAIAFDGR